MPPTSGGFVMELLHFCRIGPKAQYHRALQVGWSRFRAVLMLLPPYPLAVVGVNGTKVISW
jgi:hypothetical protein